MMHSTHFNTVLWYWKLIGCPVRNVSVCKYLTNKPCITECYHKMVEILLPYNTLTLFSHNTSKHIYTRLPLSTHTMKEMKKFGIVFVLCILVVIWLCFYSIKVQAFSPGHTLPVYNMLVKKRGCSGLSTEGRKFYLMMHSTHFIYGYMVSDIG